MNRDTERIDPTDIPRINDLARHWAAPEETILPVDIRHIVIEEDAFPALADLTHSLANGGPIVVVMDNTPMRRGPDDLKKLVEATLARKADVTIRRLPDGHPSDAPDRHGTASSAPAEYHPDRDAAVRLSRELAGAAAVVAVGSGTITDLAKYARTLAEQAASRPIPFICYPTAASVTAYTSALAILMLDGCKRTFSSSLPDAIVCDLRTLAQAPPMMTAAGFADVLARSVAYGDWFLAGRLGMDDAYSDVPDRLLKPAEQSMIDHAAQIAAGDIHAIRTLTEALLLAGMSMSVLNHTAPISGWEHVISHCLDMTAESDGRSMALHGGQVGVGTLVSAIAYDQTWKHLDLDRIAAETGDAEAAACRQTIDAVFGPSDPTGRMTAEIRREMDTKLDRWQRSRHARLRFADQKRAGELDEPLARLVRSRDEIAAALRNCGAPTRFADLDKPVTATPAHRAVQFGHLVRSRFTLGDLLTQSGWLSARTTEQLVAQLA